METFETVYAPLSLLCRSSFTCNRFMFWYMFDVWKLGEPK